MKKPSNLSSFSRNVISYALLQVVTLLVGLVLPRFFLEVYGSEINGVISTANSFISYFSYIEAGIGAALMHALFKPLAVHDVSQINGIVSYSAKEYRRISCIYFVLVVLLSSAFPHITYETSLATWEFSGLFFVIGLYGAIDFYTMAKYRVLLLADKKEYILSIAGIAAQLVRFVLVWIALTMELNVIFVKCLPIATLMVRTVILKLYIRKNYPEVVFKAKKLIRPTEDVGKRWDALFLQISINASMTFPTIVISQICGYVQANVFAIYYLVCSAVISLVSSLSSGIAPILGQAIAKGEDVSRKYNLYEFFIAVVLTVVFSTAALLIVPFVSIYTNVVSDADYINNTFAYLILVWGAIHSYRIPYTAVINATAIYDKMRKLNITNLILLFVSCLGFTYFLGIQGTIISMVLVAMHRNLSFLFILNKYSSFINVKTSFFRMIAMIILLSAFFVLGIFINGKIKIVAFPALCIYAVICFAISSIIVLVFFSIINKALFKNILEYLRSICRKRNA